jgi:hypothetical protein
LSIRYRISRLPREFGTGRGQIGTARGKRGNAPGSNARHVDRHTPPPVRVRQLRTVASDTRRLTINRFVTLPEEVG